jgi:hypothetical protein
VPPLAAVRDVAANEEQAVPGPAGATLVKRLERTDQGESLVAAPLGRVTQIREARDPEPSVVHVLAEEVTRLRGAKSEKYERREQRQLVGVARLQETGGHECSDVWLREGIIRDLPALSNPTEEGVAKQGQRTLKMNSEPTKGRFSGHLLII